MKERMVIYMPYGDGTGPMGYGPGTGRGVGPCGGGRFGVGRGYSRGIGGRRFISPKNELMALEDEEQMLENELQEIKEEKAALKRQQK